MIAKNKYIVYLLVLGLTAITVYSLGNQFWLLTMHPQGGIDLRQRYVEMTNFFGGFAIYDEIAHAIYPPASYVMLWPLAGAVPKPYLFYYWAATTGLALLILSALLVQLSKAKRTSDKLFWAMFPLATYSVAATVSNANVGIHIMPCLVGLLLLASKKRRSLWEDTAIAALMLFCMIKPSVSAPFFWILVFVAIRPAILTALGYVALSQFAALWRPNRSYDPVELFRAWLDRAMGAATHGSTQGKGIASIDNNVTAHSILDWLNLSDKNAEVTFGILVILGIWVFFNRRRDIFILAGVSAIASKYWTYHGWYDDIILIITALAVFRIANNADYSRLKRGLAQLIFAAMVLFSLAPGGVYNRSIPKLWKFRYLMTQSVIWTMALILLLFAFKTRPPKPADQPATSTG